MKRRTTIMRAPDGGGELGVLIAIALALAFAGWVLWDGYQKGTLTSAFLHVQGVLGLLGLLHLGRGVCLHIRESARQARLLKGIEGAGVWAKIASWTEDSASWRLFEAVRLQQGRMRGALETDEFFELFEASMIRHVMLARRCGKLALEVGLTATTVGLTLMFTGMDVSDGESLGAWLFGENGMVGSLAMCFATTAVGFGISFLLSCLAFVVEDGGLRISDYLREVVARDIKPAAEGAE